MESESGKIKHRPERVMIVSKFFSRRGGAEIHAIELERLLAPVVEATAVYAMHHSNNVEPVGKLYEAPEVSITGSLGNRLRATNRIMGGAGVVNAFEQALDDFKPTVVHLHNIHSYLSPVVAQIASERGIRVVWTLHDYKLLCPSYSFLRRGEECRDCLSSKSAVLLSKCMKDSVAASAVAYAEALKWRRNRIEKWVDSFICPSSFMADRMSDGGYDGSKLIVLPNFTTLPAPENVDTPRSGICYIGRLSKEKGVDMLLEVAAEQGWPLTVAGDGPLAQALQERYATSPNIRFTGHLTADEIRELLLASQVAAVPSDWDENCSLSIIEALTCGTPVVASDAGGNPDLIEPASGLLFKRGDKTSLRKALQQALAMDWNHTDISRQAVLRFSPDTYLKALLPIYAD